MAPTLLAQLITAVTTKDATTFTVLLKIMAAACHTTESQVLTILAYHFGNGHYDLSHYLNTLAKMLIQTDRVSDYRKIFWSGADHFTQLQLCWDQPQFMAKVLADYEQELLDEQSNSSSPIDCFDQLQLYFYHKIVCSSAISADLVTVRPEVEVVTAAILADQANTEELIPLGQDLRQVVEFAIVMEAKTWLASLTPPWQLSENFYHYQVKTALANKDLSQLHQLAKTQPDQFLANYFDSLFNLTASMAEASLIPAAQAIMTMVLDHNPSQPLQLQISALCHYHDIFIDSILRLIGCGKAELVGPTAALKPAQIAKLWDHIVEHCHNHYYNPNSTGQVSQFMTTAALTDGTISSHILSHNRIEWSDRFYRYINSHMVNLKAKVELFKNIFFNQQINHRQPISFTRADLMVIRAALAQYPHDKAWFDLLAPQHWADKEALALLYHTTTDKKAFLGYALACQDKSVTNEVYQAFTTAKTHYYDLNLVLKQVNDLTMLNSAGVFVEYLSQLDSKVKLSYHPENFLLPELTSYYLV